MQIKYGLQKEWLHFFRTFRFGGVIIAVFGVSLAIPLLYKFLLLMLQWSQEMLAATPGITAEDMEAFGDYEMLEQMFNSSATMFGLSMSDLAANALLITMLILMSPCGGEQKKRATIIPSCSGLEYRDYLIPKFILYPAVSFVTNFLASVCTGFLCDAIFTADKVGAGNILLNSFLCAIYVVFLLCIYMCLGLCMSRPAIATVIIYFGQNLINIILMNLNLTRFNPFTLYNTVSVCTIREGADVSAEAGSLVVAVILSLVISVLMFFLTLAALSAKRINNQEDKPEF